MLLSKEHLNNLSKLADFLKTNITDEQFNIENFRSEENGDFCGFQSLEKCGTIGCALGWAPFIIPSEKNDCRSNARLNFDIYSARIFGVFVGDGDVGTYMFSSHWAGSDEQSRIATIKRIRAVVESKGKLTERMHNKMFCEGMV